MTRKILAAVLIAAGLAALSVPLFYHIYGSKKTDELIGQFEQSVEQEYMEDNEREKENKNENEAETEDAETSVSETDAAMLSSSNVIGVIEIDALDLKYPVVEGADSKQLSYGIGHIPNTAAIGSKGNCVLAGHRGSRYGTYFKYLNKLSEGDMVKITDKEGNVHWYEVYSWEVVGPYDNSVKAQREKAELTLLTCENRGTMRLIYHCIYKEGEQHGKGIQTGGSGRNSCGDGTACRSAGRLSGKR